MSGERRVRKAEETGRLWKRFGMVVARPFVWTVVALGGRGRESGEGLGLIRQEGTFFGSRVQRRGGRSGGHGCCW